MKTESKNQQDIVFPRTYQVDLSWRRSFKGFSVFLLTLFVLMTILHLTRFMAHPLALLDLAGIDFLVALFVIWVGSRINRRVVLYEDAIEVKGWISKRRLERGEILGVRMGSLPVTYGGISYYIIVPVSGGKRVLRLPPYLHVDETFISWVETIPRIKNSSPIS